VGYKEGCDSISIIGEIKRGLGPRVEVTTSHDNCSNPLGGGIVKHVGKPLLLGFSWILVAVRCH